jgi:hypothetical protein
VTARRFNRWDLTATFGQLSFLDLSKYISPSARINAHSIWWTQRSEK